METDLQTRGSYESSPPCVQGSSHTHKCSVLESSTDHVKHEWVISQNKKYSHTHKCSLSESTDLGARMSENFSHIPQSCRTPMNAACHTYEPSCYWSKPLCYWSKPSCYWFNICHHAIDLVFAAVQYLPRFCPAVYICPALMLMV